MKPSHLAKAIHAALDADRPVCVWGGPGTGKSQIIAQVANARALALIDLRLSLLDAVDLRGLPSLHEGRTTWNTPSFFPQSGEGILFFDEINLAPPSVQSAAYQLVHDRALGDYRLPAGWRIIAAANRDTDRGYTHRMAAPLANRFTHLDIETDLADWTAWAMAANVSTELISFLRYRPGLLNRFDPQSSSKAFPTPRTWHFLDTFYQQKPDPAIEYPLYAGTVGEGPAGEFLSFVKIFRQLPSPDQIFLNPQSVDVPTDPATLYALTGALAARASLVTFPAIVQFSERMPAEFSVLMIRDCLLKCPELDSSRAWIDWAVKNQDVLF